MERLKSHVSPDIFLHIPGRLSSDAGGSARGATSISATECREAQQHGVGEKRLTTLNLVFFVTGNPGLIAYYHPFLAGLVRDFDGEAAEDRALGVGPLLAVAGFSLGGFEVEDWSGRDRSGSVKFPDQRGKVGEGQEQEQEQGQGRDREGLRDLLFPDLAASPSTASVASGGSSKDQRGKAEDTRREQKIYSLAEQVALCYARLENLVRRLRMQCEPSQGSTRSRQGIMKGQETTEMDANGTDIDINIKVTLIGHSVGAYIALELVRLRHEQRILPPTTTATTSSNNSSTPWKVSSCILLTPTIQDLHLSSSGRIASPLLKYLPFLPNLAHALVQNVLVKGLSERWFEAIVQGATGMQARSHGLAATVAFLRSRTGVCQALEMARCELRDIGKESWGEEVWGVVAATGEEEGEEGETGLTEIKFSPRLFFWFARQDHWVADVTREEILQTRGMTGFVARENELGSDVGEDKLDGGRNQSPRIRIDETDGLIHAWCLTQSELVTRQVSGWLKELWDQDWHV